MLNRNQTEPGRTDSPRVWMVVGACLVFGVLVKLLPYLLTAFGYQAELSTNYPWSFTPMLAICLFAGAMLANRWVSCGMLLGSLLVSDLAIWGITGHFNWAFYPTLPINYCCFLAIAVLGDTTLAANLARGRVWGKSLIMGLAASVGYFIVTNFVSWISLPEYTKDLSGLIQCYTAAIPFYRNTLLGTLLYTAILFSPAMLHEIAGLRQASGVGRSAGNESTGQAASR